MYERLRKMRNALKLMQKKSNFLYFAPKKLIFLKILGQLNIKLKEMRNILKRKQKKNVFASFRLKNL